ncbi:hypothetical protein NH621_04520 [Lactococcus formosensis]|uniref:hypothetical protein n=1 Tax=Lactococcus formosensis TaxID=1281486 RepID=UPI002096FF94|nr:hypothetical protein [Lactococcus formosensis]MCO7180447.1 hypothetical protein [Lactococcus formosensis]
MSISLDELVKLLKTVNSQTFRGKAPPKASYPYIVYSNISMGKKVASSKTLKLMPLYQISLFTTGTEKDLKPLEIALRGIPHTDFNNIQGDENDDTVTNFYTQIRVVENIEE